MTTYSDSGVDIDLAESAKAKIKEYARSTFTENTISKAGFFCGGVKLELKGFKEPVLMASTDGVGTKMAIAKMMNKFDTVGIDLVNHSANDLLTSGAKPLMFLDYIASDKTKPGVAAELVKGAASACKKLGIALVGGETAQMPGTYIKGETDFAGTIVGVVEKSEIIDGSEIKEENALIGIAANGLHTNGYSLARKVLFDICGYDVHDKALGDTIGNILLTPHKEYVSPISKLKSEVKVKGIAHITGGGLTDNVPRILPDGLGAKIKTSTWNVPPIFRLIQEKGNVPIEDMLRTFNMGIGMVIAVEKTKATAAIELLRRMNEDCRIIGSVEKGKGVRYAED